MSRIAKNTLVAIMASKADFELAASEGWYRIPTRIKRVPEAVKNKTLKFLAFYHTKAFGAHAYSVRYVAYVRGISIARRRDLVPVPPSPAAQAIWLQKAEEAYYKIEIGPLKELPRPIVSKKWRRIVFIETTDLKLSQATEINDLFSGNRLEERFYAALKSSQIAAERQYYVEVKKKPCFLDFALFCKDGKINIECDGGYHNDMPQVDEDRGRNNLLQSEGWAVLRFSADDVFYGLESSIQLVQETIVKYGGLK